MKSPAAPDRLLQAYLAADYAFRAQEAWMALRPGDDDGGARQWLEQRASAWGFVTACNPRSAPLCGEENRARHENLSRELEALGWRCLPAEGRDPAGRWPAEPGFLVLDRPLDDLIALAERHGQAALLYGEPGRPSCVVVLEPDWRDAVARHVPAARMAGVTGLEVTDLAVNRGDDWILRGVNFRLRGGECLSVTGPNGSGKTTLLRVLAGLLPPHAGRIRWRGADCGEDGCPPAEMLFLGHRLAIRDELTALENLAFLCKLHGVDAANAETALADLGLRGLQDAAASRLSAGQRKRIALARLALDRRALWLLDEPFANMDPAGAGRVAELISGHVDAGGLVALSSHGEPPQPLPRLRHLALGAVNA